MSEEDVAKTDVNDTQDPAIQFVTCPCCGKPTLPRPVNPNPELVDHWLACMTTGTPFAHAYPVYGGRLTITVARLSSVQADNLDQATSILDLLRVKPWPDGGAPVNFDLLRGILRRLVSVKEIRLNSAHPMVFTPQAVVLECCDKVITAKTALLAFEDMEMITNLLSDCYKALTNPELVSAVPDEMLLAVLNTHAGVNEILMSAGFDSNFWKGIELA